MDLEGVEIIWQPNCHWVIKARSAVIGCDTHRRDILALLTEVQEIRTECAGKDLGPLTVGPKVARHMTNGGQTRKKISNLSY